MSNRLAEAQSLYLRKHAHNPIDWWPWSEAALEKAQQEDKPIFLSVGYSSCHWCTVMEGEAFSDPAIAAYMNANFLPIKVDREERPDLDSIYMQAVQMIIGQGGWPLNVFLTPGDLVPFYGGTYFPVEPKYGRPGFLQVLQAIRNYYDGEKAKLQSIKTELLDKLRGAAVLPVSSDLNYDILTHGLEANTGVLSSKMPGPSFPMIPYAEVALRSRRFQAISLEPSPYDASALSQQRGLDLALGGIFDHVAGGFHRYTVDSTWTVPHFEKMLYDNGQIIEYLANLWADGVQEPAIQRAIAQTVQWLQREMTDPAGFFYAAQDADSFSDPTEAEPEEGAFYVWDYQTLKQYLSTDELAELQAHFTVTSNGNFEGYNVLQRRQPGSLSPLLEHILDQLFVLRYGRSASELATVPPAQDNRAAKETAWPGRIPPVTDTKMIVAWNSLMISGLARAATVLQRSDYLQLAQPATQFILNHQWVKGRFHRVNYAGQAEVIAQSEDYALFIKALLDLHQASLALNPSSGLSPAQVLETAVRVQDEFDEFLWSIEMGGYYNTDNRSDLLIRERSYIDNATPAANGIAAINLIRLALLTGELAYLDRAEQTLQAFAIVMQQSPSACPSLVTALDWFHHHTLLRTRPEQFASLATRYLPSTVFVAEDHLPEGAIGLVCRGLSCQEPAHTHDQLWQQLRASQVRQSPS